MSIQPVAPATPAPAATPASKEPQGASSPSTTPQQGPSNPGQVTISTEEFAKLQRAAARAQSFQRREQLNGKRAQFTPVDPNDPNAEAIEQANQRAAAAEQRAFQADLKAGVIDLLDKPEFKDLPASTKKLILKNPSALTKSNDAEEALLDIEDFVREAALDAKLNPTNPANPQNQPKLETPPVATHGAPPPTQDVTEESIEGKTGPARSQAILRNLIRKGNQA